MDENQASWNDEFCLLTTRTAIIIPSPRWRDYEIAVATVPSATLRVKYDQYWDGIERLIEFTLEIRVLAQLVESVSYDLLVEIVDTVQATRTQMFNGDIQFDEKLPLLTTQAAHLRRLSSLAQNLSHAHLWSRAEYAMGKAEHMFEQLSVAQTLEHIERNMENINQVVDHVDEWYLADLSEQNNDRTNLLSLGLAAGSLTLTLLMLPSFWKDLDWDLQNWFEVAFGIGGTILAIILIVLAVTLIGITFRRRQKMLALIHRIMEKN